MANSCDCPFPPGGRAECADDQFAICTVENGVPVGRCIDLPVGLVPGSIEFQNWVLKEVTGRPRRAQQPLTQTDRDILEVGEFEDPIRGIRVTFRLPLTMGGTATA